VGTGFHTQKMWKRRSHSITPPVYSDLMHILPSFVASFHRPRPSFYWKHW